MEISARKNVCWEDKVGIPTRTNIIRKIQPIPTLQAWSIKDGNIKQN